MTVINHTSPHHGICFYILSYIMDTSDINPSDIYFTQSDGCLGPSISACDADPSDPSTHGCIEVLAIITEYVLGVATDDIFNYAFTMDEFLEMINDDSPMTDDELYLYNLMCA